MIKSACELATQGFRVFPLRRDSKKPLAEGWQKTASSEQFQVYETWVDDKGREATYNIGIACGEFVVIDVDAHKGGLEALSTLGELPRTLKVRTPRGGLHLYFRAPDGARFANSVQKLAPGIDVRGHGGYVVGPGSVIGGQTYRIEDAAPVADLPAGLAERLRQARERVTEPGSVVGALDTPAAIDAARAWLLEAPPAIEGEGGDARTYATACRVLDFGVSIETATELLAENWNERCSPAWDLEDLERKVSHAAKYRQDPIGRDNPEFSFVDIEPLPGVLASSVRQGHDANCFRARLRPLGLNAEALARLPPRRWLIPGLLESGQVTLLLAPGGSGKSAITLMVAAALALGDGRAFGLDVRKQVKTLVINAEDDEDTQNRRIGATGIFYRFDPETAIRPYVTSYSRHAGDGSASRPLWLASRGPNGAPVATPDVEAIAQTIIAESIGLVILDPLAACHGLNENDNGEMNFLMSVITGLARRTGAAFLVPHHTKKPNHADSKGFTGDADAGRGASAIKDAARIVKTLLTMSPGEVKCVLDHRLFVRLDDAKANYAPLNSEPQWFKKRTEPLGNGETELVLEPVKLGPSAAERERAEACEQLTETLMDEALANGKKLSPSPKARNSAAKHLVDHQSGQYAFTKADFAKALAGLENLKYQVRTYKNKSKTCSYYVPSELPKRNADGSPTVCDADGSDGSPTVQPETVGSQ